MESRRFDALTQAFSVRLSRRRAVHASTLGLAAGLAGATPLVTHAQATPVASPAAATDDRTYFLFVQVATSGVFTPKQGETGMYTLVLEHGVGETVYFSDRPERIVGTVPTSQFFDGLGFTPDNPPNAALVAGEQVVVIELLDPVFDAPAGTLTYDVRVLDDYAEAGLEHLAARASGAVPETFGSASLFIDDCSDDEIVCVDASDDLAGVLGTFSFCWSFGDFCCEPCQDQDWAALCNAKFPDCNGGCREGRAGCW